MARVVVVASSEPSRATLAEHVAPDDELIVVVPAVEQSALQWLANDEDDARAQAGAIGAAIGEKAPADASAVEVKPDPPHRVVEDAIAEHHPDLVVVAVREGEDATWLEKGELDRVPPAVAGVPVLRLSI